MKDKIRILDIVEGTSVDGPGLRTAIYCAGCENRCEGCHNPQSWNLEGGREMTLDSILAVVAQADMNVTFTGGDPMLQAEAFAALARMIRSRLGKTVWCYTGYLYEQCLTLPSRRRLLEEVDVLVDGPYIAAERDLTLHFRGSRNQRIIDVVRSLAAPSAGPVTVDFGRNDALFSRKRSFSE